MAESAIYLDMADLAIAGTCEVLSWTVVDGLYVKTSKGLLCRAYVYPESQRAAVSALLTELKDLRKAYGTAQHAIFAKLTALHK